MRPREVGFSWGLMINNQSVGVPFGSLKFSHALDGFGESGVITEQFEFDLYDATETYGTAILEGATAQLVETNSYCLPSKTYYIAKRSISKKVCHFTAYDVMSKSDRDFDPSGLSAFTDDEGIPCGNVLEAVKTQCGFTSIAASGQGFDYIRFKHNHVTNRTCREVLEMVAEAMCGVWLATYDDGAVLSCLGSPYDTTETSIDTTLYTEIDYQGRQKITGLMLTNSDTGNVNLLTTGEYGVIISVDSPLVAAGTNLDQTVWERINGYIYQAWHCDKAIIDGLACAASMIGFNGTDMLTNNVSLAVDSTGIYFSGGCDPQDEEQWRYREYLDRTKIGIGKAVGNTTIDNNGDIVFKNLNNGGGGLSGRDNGISIYVSDN